MHKALYRKYRPVTFTDGVGQNHITLPLAWQCENSKTSHAYLFCGSRGTGKTSCAKILAKAVNCENPTGGNPCNTCESCISIDKGTSMLVYEMDAASNTSVEYVRGIKEEIAFTPATSGVKVYIIDEVHMLSEGAFNALLKTLEEPPSGVMFILATTETRKVPATILSRCQRFDFRRITIENIASRLKYICEKENIEIDDEAAVLIGRIAQGGMRDAISMLELCAGDGVRVTAQAVRDTSGIFGRELASRIVKAISEKNPAEILNITAEVYNSSKDIAVLVADIISYYRDMTVQRALSVSEINTKTAIYFDLTSNEFAEVKKYASMFSYEKLIYHYKLLSALLSELARSDSKRVSVEMTLLKMASDKSDASVESLSARVADIERRLVRAKAVNTADAEANAQIQIEAEEIKQENKPKEDQSKEQKVKQDGLTITRSLWNNIVGKFSSVEPAASTYVKSAKAYCEGDFLVIAVQNGFMKMLLESVNAEQTIYNILAGEDARFKGVKIAVGENGGDDYSHSFIDDLL